MGSDLVNLLLKYGWFILGFISLTQLITVPKRAAEIAGRTGENQESVRSFLYRYAIFITIPYFVLGSLQLLGGFDDLFYVLLGPLDNPYVLAAVLYIFLWWGIGAYIIFFRGGAKQIAEYGVMSRGAYTMSETNVKLLTAGSLIFLAVWMFVGRLVFPAAPF